MRFQASCKSCKAIWHPTSWHLSVVLHEMGLIVSGVRHGKTDYCLRCRKKEIEADIAELKAKVEAGACPGPLLWGKV